MAMQEGSPPRNSSSTRRTFDCLMLLLIIMSVFTVWNLCSAADSGRGGKDLKSVPYGSDASYDKGTETPGELSTEERIANIESMLESIRKTGEKAEDRSYYNKMMSMELVRYVKIMVAVLIVIAVLFPVTLWLLSNKRLIGLSGLSSEVTATILLVEERQAKLANLLKEIQQEIDYMQNMSAPDLRKLIEQAERYLKQNERDLKMTGSTPQKTDPD